MRRMFLAVIVFGVLVQCMGVPIAMLVFMPPGDPYRSTLVAFAFLLLLLGAAWVIALRYVIRKKRPWDSPDRTLQDVAKPDGFRALLAKLGDKGISLPTLVVIVSVVAALLLVGQATLMTQRAVDEFTRLDPGAGEALPDVRGNWALWSFSAVAAAVLISVLVLDARRRLATRRATILAMGTQLAPPSVLAALDRISLAAGVRAPSLRMVHQTGANCAVSGPADDPAIIVTTGAIQALEPAALEVLFANMLARLEIGAVSEATAADQVQQAIGPPDLELINTQADARTLLLVKDADRVLTVMDAMARLNRRMESDSQMSPACFFCWPHEPPPLDMPDRVRRLVKIAGPAGELWWRTDQERRRSAAARELGLERGL